MFYWKRRCCKLLLIWCYGKSAMLGMNFTYITSYMGMDEALDGLTAAERTAFRQYVPEGVVSPNWDTKMDAERENCRRPIQKYSPECKFIETNDINAIKGVDVITTENWGFFTDPVETCSLVLYASVHIR